MTKLSIILILIGTCTVWTTTVHAEDGAPFGLTWGQTKEQVETLGVTMTPIDEDAEGETYIAKNVPKILSDIQVVQLSFGFSDALHRISAASVGYKNDPYGADVRKRYNELNGLLAKKYGLGESHHYQDSEMWTDADEFLMGIKTGRSWHYTNYTNNNVFVQIGIKARSGSSGYYVLIYKNKSLAEKAKEQSKEKEKDAL